MNQKLKKDKYAYLLPLTHFILLAIVKFYTITDFDDDDDDDDYYYYYYCCYYYCFYCYAVIRLVFHRF